MLEDAHHDSLVGGAGERVALRGCGGKLLSRPLSLEKNSWPMKRTMDFQVAHLVNKEPEPQCDTKNRVSCCTFGVETHRMSSAGLSAPNRG